MALSPALASGFSTAGSVAKELAPVAVAIAGSALTVKWLQPKPTFADKISAGADDVNKYLGMVSTFLTLWDRMFPEKKETVAQMSQAEIDAMIQKGVEQKYAAEKAAAEKAAADEKRIQESIAAGIAQYVASQKAATPATQAENVAQATTPAAHSIPPQAKMKARKSAQP
jgi:hypothetical protein